jgi:hypothetical protein
VRENGSESRGAIDRALTKIGRERRILTTVANFTTLMFHVAQSDLIAAVGERIARRMAELVGVSMTALPCRWPGIAAPMQTRDSAGSAT